MGDTGPDHLMGRPRRCLALIPKAVQPNADRVDESVHTFTDACKGDRSHQGEWHRPADAGKVMIEAALTR